MFETPEEERAQIVQTEASAAKGLPEHSPPERFGPFPPMCESDDVTPVPATDADASAATPSRVPADYKRDQHGRVSTAEMNRYLPRWRCSTCGQWLFGSELHTLKDCERRVNLDA